MRGKPQPCIQESQRSLPGIERGVSERARLDSSAHAAISAQPDHPRFSLMLTDYHSPKNNEKGELCGGIRVDTVLMILIKTLTSKSLLQEYPTKAHCRELRAKLASS